MNVTLGKYQAFDTVFHKIDSRVKLVAFILLMVAIFLNYGQTNAYGAYTNLVIYGLIFVLLFIIMLASKTSFLQLFRSLKALWVMLLFLVVLNFILPGNVSGDIAFSLWGKDVYYATIVNVSYIIFRLVLIMMMTSVFTSTTKPMEMTGALEWLFYPFKFIGLPIHKIAMAISLALRFVPTLIEETNRIMKAQASRGVDYNHGKFKEKVHAIISLIIPLFMTAFLTSGELADAMEARGYDPDSPRTRYKTYHWSLRDTVSVVVLVLFFSGMVTLAVLRFDLTDLFPNLLLPILKENA